MVSANHALSNRPQINKKRIIQRRAVIGIWNGILSYRYLLSPIPFATLKGFASVKMANELGERITAILS